MSRISSASLARWYDHPRAPLAAWIMMVVLVAAGMANFAYTIRRIEQAACEGARDTRQVIISMLEYTGEQQVNADEYTGELRDAVIQSQQRAEEFRDAQIAALTRPPPQCVVADQ